VRSYWSPRLLGLAMPLRHTIRAFRRGKGQKRRTRKISAAEFFMLLASVGGLVAVLNYATSVSSSSNFVERMSRGTTKKPVASRRGLPWGEPPPLPGTTLGLAAIEAKNREQRAIASMDETISDAPKEKRIDFFEKWCRNRTEMCLLDNEMAARRDRIRRKCGTAG